MTSCGYPVSGTGIVRHYAAGFRWERAGYLRCERPPRVLWAGTPQALIFFSSFLPASTYFHALTFLIHNHSPVLATSPAGALAGWSRHALYWKTRDGVERRMDPSRPEEQPYGIRGLP